MREEECEREVEGERGKNVREWWKVREGRTGREWRQRKPGCKGAMCSFLLLLHQVHQAKPDGQFLLMNTQFVCTLYCTLQHMYDPALGLKSSHPTVH